METYEQEYARLAYWTVRLEIDGERITHNVRADCEDHAIREAFSRERYERGGKLPTWSSGKCLWARKEH